MSSSPIIEAVTGHLQTTTGSSSSIITFATTTGATHQVWVQIVGISTGSTEGGGWVLSGTYKNVGGTLTNVSSSTTAEHRDDAKWTALLNNSGTNILVDVQGDAADTIDWVAYAEIATSLG